MTKRARNVALVLAVAFAASLAWIASIVRYGFSAHDEPTKVEALVARAARHWSVPSGLRTMRNPLPLTDAAIVEGREHFADHCAGCHGNDGKGSDLGKQMYPKAPDMTLEATQSMSDGELFSIIENGVRLTGMPGFGNGTAASAQATWQLVHFIRHLPKVTPEELAAMRELNPKSPAEWEQMKDEEAFLSGEETPAETPAHHH